MESRQLLWVAFQTRPVGSDDGDMELIGVFSDEQLATAACREPTDCIWPAELNAVAPRERTENPQTKYPLLKG